MVRACAGESAPLAHDVKPLTIVGMRHGRPVKWRIQNEIAQHEADVIGFWHRRDAH
jgi:hypothetical protein